MERWTGKVAIVTGASGGIGQAITIALVQRGLKVVGVGRRIEKIQQLADQLSTTPGQLYPMHCDLQKEEDILNVFRYTEEKFGGANILVNNAGIIVPGKILESSTEGYRKIIDTNVIAPTICIREAVKSLQRRRAPGHIININSLAGHFAESINFPLNLYPASKYALNAMTTGVQKELVQANLDVKITSISPGAVSTDMITSIGMSESQLKQLSQLTPADIADAVIYTLGTPPGTQVKEIMIMPQELKSNISPFTQTN